MRRSHIIEGVCVAIIAAVLAGIIIWTEVTTRPAPPAPVPAPKPPADPLVYKSKGHLRVVRAVFHGDLYLLVFEHRAGVWFLDGVKPASEIKS